MGIGYLFQEALRSFGRSRRIHLIALGAMSMALMALGIVLLLNLALYVLIHHVESKIEVVAFLNEDLAPEAVTKIQNTIELYPEVAGVEWVSKATSLERFKKDPAIKELLGYLKDNPLPDYFRIVFKEKKPRVIQEFVNWLNEQPAIADASYGGGEAAWLLGWLQFGRAALLGLTLCLVLAAIIIIANIIQLLVFSRRKEIYVLGIVGASHWFIRWPFLFWGAIQGALSGLLACLALAGLWFGLNYLARQEMGFSLNAMLPVQSMEWAALAGGALVALGIGLGFAGTLVSVGRQFSE
jgi:cell division transport system permease protein